MFWPMTRRAIASIVGFFLGWTIFQIVKPVENVPVVETLTAQVLEIKLVSKGCTDAALDCPVFEMTLRSNGTGLFAGHANHWLKGKFEGTFPEDDFNLLVDELYKQEFFDSPDDVVADAVVETIVVEVVTNEGTHRVTSYSWDSMDGALRAIHARLWYEQYYVDWEEVK